MTVHELFTHKTKLSKSSAIKPNQDIFCTRLTMNPLLHDSTTPVDFSHFAVHNQPQFQQIWVPWGLHEVALPFLFSENSRLTPGARSSKISA
jgi:hypothetical protein